MTAVEIHSRLEELETARVLAMIEGVAADSAYVTDLVDQIAATRAAYVGTAVAEIASLRAELSGPQLG